MLQSEYGDLYKVTLAYSGDTVTELKIKYFDTIPPCISICVLKTGFLFAASEFGNHALYQFLVRQSLPLPYQDPCVIANTFSPFISRVLASALLMDAVSGSQILCWSCRA